MKQQIIQNFHDRGHTLSKISESNLLDIKCHRERRSAKSRKKYIDIL